LVNYLIGTLAADSGIQSSATAAVLSNKDNWVTVYDRRFDKNLGKKWVSNYKDDN
jgi:hypothetical protein